MRTEDELLTVYETMKKVYNDTARKTSGYYPITFLELQTLEYALGMISLKEWHKSIYDLLEKK